MAFHGLEYCKSYESQRLGSRFLPNSFKFLDTPKCMYFIEHMFKDVHYFTDYDYKIQDLVAPLT